MKKLFSLALAVLLCLGCLVPAFAADVSAPAAATEAPSDATQEQPQQETAPDAEQPALPEAYLKWAHGGQYDDRGAFDRAFRQYYAADPDVTIIDHMVYVKSTMWSGWNKKVDCYRLIDFFDSDAAEAAATALCVPAEAGGLPVTMLAYDQTIPALTDAGQAFSNSTVKKVTIAEGFTVVPPFAFRNFTALKTVVLPTSMLHIGKSAFENCKKLKKVIGQTQLSTVETAAFKNCKKLSVFDSMQTLLNIQGEAFRGCAFQSLTLPGSLRIFGPQGDMDYYADTFAFADCKKLKSVTFLPGKKSYRLWIGASTFRGCTALESVTLPKKCKGVSILHRAFQDCTALKTLNATKKLASIGSKAFARSGLERLILTDSAKMIAEDAFAACKGLKTLDIRSADVDLFGRVYSLYGTYFYGNDYAEEHTPTTNFLKHLPKSCTVFVPTLEMKQIAQAHGCTAKLKIKADVPAPKKLKAASSGGTVTLKWSAVQGADGYRVYAVNVKTGALTPLKTLAAPTVRVTLKASGKAFAVKAFCDIDGDRSWSKPTIH
ncbi:MAG: leucine-rich repeat domain-containing protein [Clostridia bacterium]|nr:leucine-rich repeat domain-containing protein [Clostridia bacterium]